MKVPKGKEICIIISSLFLFGCDLFLPWIVEFDKERFDQEWAAWESQELLNYSVSQGHDYPSIASGFYARITVKDNLIVEKKALDKWSLSQLEKNPDYIPIIFNYVKTISEIYDWVNNRYESRAKKGLSIIIEYNEKYHYPEYIYIHHSSYKEQDGSGGSIVRMSEFVPLP